MLTRDMVEARIAEWEALAVKFEAKHTEEGDADALSCRARAGTLANMLAMLPPRIAS